MGRREVEVVDKVSWRRGIIVWVTDTKFCKLILLAPFAYGPLTRRHRAHHRSSKVTRHLSYTCPWLGSMFASLHQ